MRKGWVVIIAVVVVFLGVPTVAIHGGFGDWVMQKLLALHGKHGTLHGHGSSAAKAPSAPKPSSSTAGNRALSGLRLETDGAGDAALRIKEVREPSPASAAGLRPDDVLVAIDGTPVTLSNALETLDRIGTFTLSIRRGTQTLTTTITTRPIS